MVEANPFMTLERARNTYWLKNNYRPMGELFDSGFLTQSRLEWGAKNAYDPAIRDACRILLKQKQTSTKNFIEKGKLPRNIYEANAVIWPFSRHTRKTGCTMGELIDSREITKRDLAYAIEKAWDEQVRTAAHIILRSQLGLEEKKMNEPKGSLKVSANRSFMEQQIESLSFKKGALWGVLLTTCAVLLILDIIYMGITGAIPTLIDFIVKTKIIGFIFVILILSFFVFIVNLVVKHTAEKKFDDYDIQIRNHKQGREGEDKVIDVMRECLDGSYHAFRNLVLPNKKEDMDIVLVGSQGVFIFEVKTYNGKYENINDDWYFCGKKRKKIKDSPNNQVKRNAAQLADFLEADFARNKTKKWVKPIVILANANAICYETTPSVPIWRIQHLADELSNISDKNVLSEQTQKEICEKLKKMYKEE